MARSTRILSNMDIDTACWRKLKAHCNESLTEMRARLENPRIEESERVALCWKIDTVKGFLALGDPTQKDVTGAGE